MASAKRKPTPAELLVLEDFLPYRLSFLSNRISRAIGALLAVVVFYIRTGLEETSSYIHAVEGEAKRGST